MLVVKKCKHSFWIEFSFIHEEMFGWDIWWYKYNPAPIVDHQATRNENLTRMKAAYALPLPSLPKKRINEDIDDDDDYEDEEEVSKPVGKKKKRE